MDTLEIMLEARLRDLGALQAEGIDLLERQCRALEAIEGHLYVASVALLHHALATGELPETITRAEVIRQSRGG